MENTEKLDTPNLDPFIILFSLVKSLNTNIDIKESFPDFLKSVSTLLGISRLAVLTHFDTGLFNLDEGDKTCFREYSFFSGYKLDSRDISEIGPAVEKGLRTSILEIDKGLKNSTAESSINSYRISLEFKGKPATFYLLPLNSGGRSLGVLIMLKEEARAVDYDFNLSLLSCLGDQIATVLARYELFTRISLEHKRVTKLYDLVRSLDVTLTIPEICNMFLRKMKDIFNFSSAGLLIPGETRPEFFVSGTSQARAMGTQIREFAERELAHEPETSNKSMDPCTALTRDADTTEEIRPDSNDHDLLFADKTEPLDSEFSLPSIYVPLKMANKRQGLMVMRFKDDFNPTDSDRELSAIIAYHLGSVINNAREFKKNEKLAYFDGVTGISNHRKFKDILGQEFQRATRYNKNLSLLLMDIDHFKSFNDTYGHRHGDMVLKELGRVLGDTARTIDTVARYGGEEFTVILPDTDLEGAVSFAERIRAAVERTDIHGENGVVMNITVSIGASSLFFEDDSSKKKDDSAISEQDITLSHSGIDQLIEAADAAMYLAKNSGRNRVASQSDVNM